MSAPEESDRAGARAVGLCATCRHARTVETPRSVFWLCGLSRVDPRFPRYPRLPVLRCAGYTPCAPAAPDTPEP